MNKPNERHERFCREYVRRPVGRAAALAAGYGESNAAAQACRLLARPDIQLRIAELRDAGQRVTKEQLAELAAERETRLGVTQEAQARATANEQAAARAKRKYAKVGRAAQAELGAARAEAAATQRDSSELRARAEAAALELSRVRLTLEDERSWIEGVDRDNVRSPHARGVAKHGRGFHRNHQVEHQNRHFNE